MLSAGEDVQRNAMTWSIRARLTAWYSLVVVIVLVTGAVAVALVQERLAFERLDGELERLMLTLEGVMRTEFGEGLDLHAAADEASIEVVAPDRTLLLTRPDGALLAVWGRPLAADVAAANRPAQPRNRHGGLDALAGAQPARGLQGASLYCGRHGAARWHRV